MTRRAAGLWLVIVLMVVGIGIGGLMTWHHDTQLYGGAADRGDLIGCVESATVNCDIVNTSAYSELLGVPIAALAMGAYAAVIALAAIALRGRDEARTLVAVAGCVAVGLSGVLFWLSKVELGYVCSWCLRLYAVNLGFLLAALLGGRLTRPGRPVLATGAAITAGALLASAAGERLYRATVLGGAAPTVASAAGPRGADPVGDAPARTYSVVTEDGRTAELSIEPDDPWTGARDAQVAVVMFGDLECGYCKRSSAELARLEATYGDRVLFVFKHFPLDPSCNPSVGNRRHRDACAAAEAAVCAKEQGRFWAFHDLAYKNQHELGPEALRGYAERAGVDLGAFDRCLASPDPVRVVRADGALGGALDVHGTPRIFINGDLYRSGTSAEVMARAIEVALGSSAAEAARNVQSLRGSGAAIAPIPADVPAMRTVARGDRAYRIDTFEASIAEGQAVSAKHAVPALATSWFEARDACAAAGKRLCTEQEWVSACQGAAAVDDNGDGAFADDMIEGTSYPYGDFHEAGRCWDGREGDAFRPVYTGEMPGCVSADGVYDLTGNLEEWVGVSPEVAVLVGGAFDTADDHARCYRRNSSFGAGYASHRTGFRCCADAL